MFMSIKLFDVLRRYTLYQAEHEQALCILVFRPQSKEWGFYDGLNTDEVWAVHNTSTLVRILRLEPAAASAAMAVESPTDFTDSLLRYATFTASRPVSTGLHHFILVEPPESIMIERAQEATERPN